MFLDDVQSNWIMLIPRLNLCLWLYISVRECYRNKIRVYPTIQQKVIYYYKKRLDICHKIFMEGEFIFLFYWKYNNFFEGEFIVYKHKTLPFEVRTFYRNCNKKASCNCAVAVRSGDDVILIDRCGPSMGKRSPMTIKIYLNGGLTPGTKILQFSGGKKYKVHV